MHDIIELVFYKQQQIKKNTKYCKFYKWFLPLTSSRWQVQISPPQPIPNRTPRPIIEHNRPFITFHYTSPYRPQCKRLVFLTLHNFKDEDYLDGEDDDVDGGQDEDDVDVGGVKDYHGDAMSWDVTAVGGDICQSPDKEAVQCCQSYLGEEMQKSKYLCASAPG